MGYSADARGHDAVNLAVSLARGRGAVLELVLVVPEVSQFGAAHAPKAGFENLLNEQARQWIDEALALVPDDVPAKAHIRSGDSEALALIEASEELQAEMLIIGATSSGLFKRFTVGSVASALLHAATVPVALAPHGYHHTEALTRLSCGLGSRTGAGKLLGFAAGMATERKVPLRVVSLLSLDGGDSLKAAEAAREHAVKIIAAARPGSADQDASGPEVVVAQGRSIEEAVDHLDWQDGEVLLIGSSRLARYRSIFLGSTANRILRALPVPMIVVPSNYEATPAPGGSTHSMSNETSGKTQK
ncbi:universal stress protein [Pseudarthrobacter sp. S9]|uniref:universal stress protein n=1 Tax=Pseudarthrobacter sp. S9 TaxID=3418421 RepID=UPI003D03B794